jgi:hypothetical protein
MFVEVAAGSQTLIRRGKRIYEKMVPKMLSRLALAVKMEELLVRARVLNK